MRSDKTLKKWYRLINHKFFEGQLPDDVCVRWSNEDEDEEGFEEKYFGIADRANDGYHSYVIIMSREMNRAFSVRMSTLAHEAIHIATELKDNHGPAFEKWRQYISDRGIFKKGALPKGPNFVLMRRGSMKEKPKPDAMEMAYATEPWRCTECGIFVYRIDFIDGNFYPVAGAPQSKYISTVYNKVCNICYDMFHVILSNDYWKNVQDSENSKVRKLRPGNNYLGV